MHRFHLIALLALTACFSKPGYRGNGDGGVDAASDGAIDSPIDAPPPTALKLIQVSAGHHHACGIDDTSRLWCWGDNQDSQQGDRVEPMTGDPGPVSMTPAMQTGWTWVSAGYRHTCGIRAGTVYCWGDNDSQQSDATMTSSSVGITEVVLAAGTPVKVFAGRNLSCAILTDGSAHCWGDHDLGANQNPPAGIRVLMPGTSFDSIASAYDHACALTTTGEVRCWGDNSRFQLGRLAPASTTFDAPLAIEHVANTFTTISVTDQVSCGTTALAEALVCWGSVGRGHFPNPSAPVGQTSNYVVDETKDWSAVAIGEDHGCARTTAGDVYCYGTNLDGATGGTSFTPRTSLDPPPQITGVDQLASGDGFACAIDQDERTLSCWGSNYTGELGNRQIATSDVPRTVPLAIGANDVVRQVTTGDQHTCALVGPPTGGATAYCWGRNSNLEVSRPAATLSEPLPIVATSTAFTKITSGGHHTCGLDVTGENITCWGDNQSLQLGALPSGDGLREIPNPVSTTAWTYVSAGSSATCAIADEKLWCWGAIPGLGGSNVPQGYGMAGTAQWKWATISVGSDFAVGTALEGNRPRLVGFGKQCAATSGTGASIPPTDPNPDTLYSLEMAAVHVSAAQHNGSHTCASFRTTALEDGFVCWGVNTSKQVTSEPTFPNACEPSATFGLSPPPVLPDPTLPAPQVATGANHSCMLAADHRLYCWGGNDNHELGAIGSSGTPALVNTGTWAEVSTSFGHSCAIAYDRKSLACWGVNRYGELGDGSRFHPEPVPSGLVVP